MRAKFRVAADHPTEGPERGAIVAIGVIVLAPVNCGGGLAAPPGPVSWANSEICASGSPGCHPFAPAKIGPEEFSTAQSVAHFIFRKCSQIRAATVDMKSSHSVGFYVVAALVSSAEVWLRCALKG